MTKPVKKHEFMLPFARLWTQPECDAYDSIPFQSSDAYGDEAAPALASPISWDSSAVAVMAEAAAASIPADLRAVEQNTVPSWLWRHQKNGSRRAAESDLRDIFNRAVGSAAARAWKLGLFASEKNARAFYDETRFALMQRHIAIAPQIIKSWGLNWAYGVEETAPAPAAMPQNATELSNAAIDAVIGKPRDAAPASLWKKLFAVKADQPATVSLRLSDISAEWHSARQPAQAAIDLMPLRHNDGSINIDALRQSVRLLTILFDLQECGHVTIGIANLSPLLLALGLAYDSDAARALAASITALITAECYATSAEMAALRGASDEFSGSREAVMRSLRNHCRAVYGDTNDYEKLSVLPAPLPLKHCPDLTLLAAAQRRWDEALDHARAFGLRATQVTDLTPSPVLAVLMGSATQGLEPMPRLTALQAAEDDTYRVTLHPAINEALSRLNYPRNVASAIAQHINGSHSLRKTTGVNHASLRARGLSDSAIEKIEAYLPCVNSVRLAVTPWVVGVDFCRTQLKISLRTLEAPRFDLLKQLGFSETEIAAADLACYGHGTVRNAKILQLRHRSIFACGLEISAEARLRMAGSVQSFVSGDTGFTAPLAASHSVQYGAEITLAAWEEGLKSLALCFDPAIAAKPAAAKTALRRITASAQPHAKPAQLTRRSRNGKSGPALAARKTRPSHKAH